MDSYFNRVFWGMILVFFDINIGRVDILPNIIGVMMIATALGRLYETKEEEAFKKGVPYGWAMVIFAFIDIILKFGGYKASQSGDFSVWLQIYGQLVGVVRIMLLYYICQGVFNLGEKYNHSDISNKAKSRWLWSFVSTLGISVVMAFSLNFQEEILMVFMMIFGGIGFIVNILIIALIRTSAKTFVISDTTNVV